MSPRLWVLCLLLAVFLASAPLGSIVQARLPDESQEEMDARMKWWRDAKFGMFIHWGLYSVPAGEWKGAKVPGYAEWIMNRGKISKEEYAPLQKQFNPVKYDAAEWVRIAKDAGMKYIVITSKHHDGFCLFESEHTDYDMTGTPYGKDLLKPLAAACHDQDVKICWYHSIMDWHHPDAHNPKYVAHMKSQLKELLTNYGEIGVMWFDGEWINDWQESQGVELEKYLREIQPSLIVNNRVGKRKRSPGDFGTPEQKIPATGMPGWDWETCMTMNGTWGYSKFDHNWKSNKDLLHKLVDIVSKGGNFLLNVGPTAEGEIPAESVKRLQDLGKWMKVNGDSIYGTTASPFPRLDWGRCTKKPGTLYLHVFNWPTDGKLVVPGLSNEVTSAYLLADAEKTALSTKRDDENVVVSLPEKAIDEIDTVVVLKIEGEPEITAGDVKQADDSSISLKASFANLHGKRIKYESGDGKDNIGFWTVPADYVSWVCRIDKPGTFAVSLRYACTDPAGSDYVVEVGGQKLEAKVEPTGEWTDFKTFDIGKVTLTEDRHILTVKAKNLKSVGVMNLQSVELKPVE